MTRPSGGAGTAPPPPVPGRRSSRAGAPPGRSAAVPGERRHLGRPGDEAVALGHDPPAAPRPPPGRRTPGTAVPRSKARSRASSRGGSSGSPTSWAWVCCSEAPAAAPWLRKRNGHRPRGSASTAAIRSAQTPPGQARLLVGEVAEADEVARRVDDDLVDALLGRDRRELVGDRAHQPARPVRRPAAGRSAWVSGGVSASLPGQKGQPVPVAGRPTSWGRAARAGASRTGSSVSGSRRTGLRTPSGGAATSRSSSPGSWPWTAWTWACRPPRRRPPPCAGGSARSRAGRRPRARRRPRRPRGWP